MAGALAERAGGEQLGALERVFARQSFFIAPDFQRERAVRRFRVVDHRPHAAPSAFLVKTRGSVIADGAGEPRRLVPLVSQLSFRVSAAPTAVARVMFNDILS